MARSTVHTSAKAQKSTFVLTDRYQPPQKNQNVFIYIHEPLILMLKNAILRKSEKKILYTSLYLDLHQKFMGSSRGRDPFLHMFHGNLFCLFCVILLTDQLTNLTSLTEIIIARNQTNIARTVTTRDWTFCGASSPSTQFWAMPASNASWSVRVPYVQTIVHRFNPCDFVDHSTFMSPWTL